MALQPLSNVPNRYAVALISISAVFMTIMLVLSIFALI